MHTRWALFMRVVLVVMIGAAALSTTAQTDGEGTAVLVPVQGMVQVRPGTDAATGDWQTLTASQSVSQGDIIRTGSQAVAELTFLEDVRVEILPNSLMTISAFTYGPEARDPAYEITVGVLAGDTLHTIAQPLTAGQRYTVRTPSSAIDVHGTVFWVSTYPMGESQVRVLDGSVTVTGLTPAGEPVQQVQVGTGELVTTYPGGIVGEILPITEWPQYPPDAPLAPATCGNGVCEVAESQAGSCPADCLTYSNCGDGICDRIEGENPVVCPADCLPVVALPGEPPLPGLDELITPPPPRTDFRLHFLWGNMTCEYDPSDRINGPLLVHWGVGCFDSEVHANAHPYPADYQLYIDDVVANMTGLRQQGPYLSPPYCPWGWGFELGPITLPPGQHTLRLVETITDTWSGDSGGRNAGDMVELTCIVTVTQ